MWLFFEGKKLMYGFLIFCFAVVIENGEFDYMHPNAKCYRRQMLSSVEKFGDVPFDRNSYTHICITKVKNGNCMFQMLS